MKIRLIAMALALFSCTGLVATERSLSGKPSPTGKAFVVSKYGTLLDVLDDGKSRFGKLELEGYRVSYEIRGKLKTVSAMGETGGKGLRPGQVTVDGQAASITVTTDDGALEITSRFSLTNEKKLVISRKLRNISGGNLRLVATTQYVDPKILVDTKAPNWRQLAHAEILVAGDDHDCKFRPKECVPTPPPCPLCPIPMPQPTSDWLMEIPTTDHGSVISLRWIQPRTSVPQGRVGGPKMLGEINLKVELNLRERPGQ